MGVNTSKSRKKQKDTIPVAYPAKGFFRPNVYTPMAVPTERSPEAVERELALQEHRRRQDEELSMLVFGRHQRRRRRRRRRQSKKSRRRRSRKNN